jgi:flagellar motor switch/type III secretory pathway protein FliN
MSVESNAAEMPSPAAHGELPALSAESEESRWLPALGLPCQLTIDLPLPHFRVADLLQLTVGAVVSTEWRLARDVPLRANGTLIGWSEFEVVGNRLAVRLTELA